MTASAAGGSEVNQLGTVVVTLTETPSITATATVKQNGTGSTLKSATFDFASMGYTNGQEVTDVKQGDITLKFDKGSNTTTPKYYDGGTAIRFYAGNKVTISGATITGIEFTYSQANANTITVDSGAYTSAENKKSGTWAGETTSLTYSTSGTKGHERIQKMVVTYK